MIYRNIEFQESVEAKYWSAKRSDDYNAFCIDSGKGNSTRKNSMPSSISDHIQNILKDIKPGEPLCSSDYLEKIRIDAIGDLHVEHTRLEAENKEDNETLQYTESINEALIHCNDSIKRKRLTMTQSGDDSNKAQCSEIESCTKITPQHGKNANADLVI